ncbi:MAG: hypothetical protein B7Z03_11275 [Hydrogenophilales bacterium 32-62-9]|nr:MAG: hypothetical protein B7Z03_11275 [Hydrogenophilales bacterium 32-62-9]
MATCFVIQPFDSGKYDKRFQDIYKPAIEAAGLEAYRVDQDPRVLVPIESIEKGIRQAAICLADITADNPNVWYELGYAFASDRPVVMVCSEERTGKKYPFDIQHRSIIPYSADAPSDFDRLRESLTAKLKAIIERNEVLDQIESDPVTPIEGLTQVEVLVLAVIAGEAYMPNNAVAVNGAKRDAERAGVTNMGFNLAVRKLTTKKFVRVEELWDERDGESYNGLAVDEDGWKWIEANESMFVLHRQDKKKEEDIPF